MTRRISLPVPDDSTLDRMAGASHLFRMHAGDTDHGLLRETWFDTPAGTLRAEGLHLRLRLSADGRQSVHLTRERGVSLQGVVDEVALETPVVGGGLYATLAGSSELATAVRDVVDPASLRPHIALDIDRETRDLRPGILGRPTLRAVFDRIVAHAGVATRGLYAFELVELRPGKPSLEECVEHARTEHGLLHDGMGTVERTRAALQPAASAQGAEAVPDVRVVLVIQRGGRVALIRTARGLELPSTRGSGDEIAREYLAEALGRSDPQCDPELVGFVPSREGSPDLEVWLHECAPPDADEPPPPGVAAWMTLAELLARLGGPELCEGNLVDALLILVLSEVGARLLRESRADASSVGRIEGTPRPEGVAPGKDPADFLDTHLSICDFNQRVLELAEDDSVPLLERFRFLGIVSSNVDELFTVRVARLKGGKRGDPTEERSRRLLDVLAVRVRALTARQYRCLEERLLPALAAEGIRVRRWAGLSHDQRASLATLFERDIFPTLTPTAITSSPGHPFPHLVSLGLSLLVVLRGRDGGPAELACVPLPTATGRFLPVPGSHDVIPVEEVVLANVATLFPSVPIEDGHLFRVSRVGEVDIDEDASESLLWAMEDEVEDRPFKPVIRLEVQRTMPREVRAQLLREMHSERAGGESAWLGRADVYEMDGPLDLSGFGQLADVCARGGRYEAFTPRRPLASADSVFDVLKRGDVLVHHPYDDFDDTVGRFLREASKDPGVVSIKLTLYRTGRDSPVVDALLEALRRGKEVSVFVELKARFDEESNIAWTRRLTDAGGTVVYGVVGFKTHAKTALVVRREADGVRRYVHIGSGNYNATTARLYTDLGILSSNADLGADLTDFFNELTGSSGPPARAFRRILVAPHTLADGVIRRIEREVEHARAGRPARIQAKLNGLTDKKVVKALYRASGEGVEIDLLVRSICTLRPGRPGVSDRIRVVSILGRFLEHARIYYFHDGGGGEYFVGSADWRRRNLRRRVEVVTPVDDPGARTRLREILDAELSDPRAWILRTDGVWERRRGKGRTAQERFTPVGEEPRTSG